MLLMQDLELFDKRILIREDFNVPITEGRITHTTRIDATIPTIQKVQKMGGKIILMSHLGRPTEGNFDPAFSLKPVAEYLSKVLGIAIPLFQLGDNIQLNTGEIALLENVRFLKGEESNDPILAKHLADLGDIFVMDAFAVAHRAQASTVGVAQFSNLACAGPLLQKELFALKKIFEAPQKPVMAIVGGSKVSTKLNILKNVLEKVDILALGGGIANTFLAAAGYNIGQSLYEEAMIPTAKAIMERSQITGKQIWLPTDVVVAPTIDSPQGIVKSLGEIQSQDKIFDIGPLSSDSLSKLVRNVKTLLWNGPIGVFEQPAFEQGTKALCMAVVQAQAYSVAGGGDTLAAIEQFGISEKISYLSTGGGAFLEALEGKTLPAVAALEKDYHAQTN